MSNETIERRERVAGRRYAAEVCNELKDCELQYQEGFYRAMLERMPMPIHVLNRFTQQRRNRKHDDQ